MARLYAHGTEVGTVFGLTTAKRYMSVGTVLKNYGQGWKVFGKVKDGVTPQEAFENTRARNEAKLAERPFAARYRKMLHSYVGLSKRWKLHAAITLMSDDCDGVWSEVCDGYGDNCSLDVDEVYRLCEAYKAALQEQANLHIETLPEKIK